MGGSWPVLLLKEFSKTFLVSCILLLSPPLVFFSLGEIYFFFTAFDGRLRARWTMRSLITGTRSEQGCRERKEKEKSKSPSKEEDLEQREMRGCRAGVLSYI